VDQKWQIQSGDTKDRYTYGYDRNSNRLYRKNELSASHSELYHANDPTSRQEYDLPTCDRQAGLPTCRRPLRQAAGLGRRIRKVITNSADWDCTYKYYHDGQRMIETRDGNDRLLKQHVWGLTYTRLPGWRHPGGQVDELVQIGINQDPADTAEDTGGFSGGQCERFFWALQDANYNVIGLVAGQGLLVERYEYTPGVYPGGSGRRRTIFTRNWLIADMNDDGAVNALDYNIWSGDYQQAKPNSRADLNGDGAVDGADYSKLSMDWNKSWADDAAVTHPGLESSRGLGSSARVPLATGICDVAHQGLHFEKEFGLYYNRARYLHPTLGRWMQRDPQGYVDGMNLHLYGVSAPLGNLDPEGTWVMAVGGFGAAQIVIAGQIQVQFVFDSNKAVGGLLTVQVGVGIMGVSGGGVVTVFPTMPSMCNMGIWAPSFIGASLDIVVNLGVEWVYSGGYHGFEISVGAGASPIGFEVHTYPLGVSWLFATTANCSGSSPAPVQGTRTTPCPLLLRPLLPGFSPNSFLNENRAFLERIRHTKEGGEARIAQVINEQLWKWYRRPYAPPRCRAFIRIEDVRPGAKLRLEWEFEGS